MDRSRINPLILLFAGSLIGLLSYSQPQLQLVDFLAFCGRAQALMHRWVDPLYPPYYPSLLAGLHVLTGDALLSGRIISAASALFLLKVSLPNHRGGAIALLCSAIFLQWASTEGTDMPAAALTATGLLLCAARPKIAGLILGLAIGCRYTAIAAIPSLLWISTNRRQTLITLLLTTLPIWLPALGLGQFPVDMRSNLRGSFLGTSLPNLIHGIQILAQNPFVWIGMGALVWLPKSKTHQALALAALLHLMGCALFFTNPRLLLPSAIMMTLCAAQIQAKRTLGVVLGVALMTQFFLNESKPVPTPPPEVQHHLVAEPNCFVSNTPWAYTKSEKGWLRPGVSIQEYAKSEKELGLDAWLTAQNCSILLIDLNYPYPRQLTDKLELEAEYGHWHLYRL